MKKLGLLAVLVVCTVASAAFYNRFASDYGSKTVINHSEGVAIYPWGKLKTASAATKAHYTTVAAYPTTFSVTDATVFDAGAQVYDLVDNTTTGISGFKFCNINNAKIGSSYVSVYSGTDGGYVVTTVANLTGSTWPAFCYIQAGAAP